MMMMTEADVAAADPRADDAMDATEPERLNRPDQLIAFILERFHAVHRQELPELQALAQKVERVHAAHPACPAGLANFLGRMLEELETHMEKEERMLFPSLLAGGAGCAPFAMRRMRLEHEDHYVQLQELKRRTNAFTPPEDACGSWIRLYAGCEKLHNDLKAHIETENDELFPLFE